MVEQIEVLMRSMLLNVSVGEYPNVFLSYFPYLCFQSRVIRLWDMAGKSINWNFRFRDRSGRKVRKDAIKAGLFIAPVNCFRVYWN